MRCTVLGSGTSHGVPMIACSCDVCRSTDPRNKRFRPCFLVTADSGENILVDTPPEFRLAAIASRLERVDTVLFTHSHADHIFGLDDLRIFNWRRKEPIPLLAEEPVLDDIRRVFRYCFVPTQVGGGKPQLDLRPIAPGNGFDLFGVSILPLRVMHGSVPVLAYVFGGRLGYVTDVSEIPPESWDHLKGLDVLFLDGVRREPHSTHFHLARSLEVIEALAPKRAYLVHLSHDYDHAATNAELPAGVELAYDGLAIDLGADEKR